MVNTTTVAAVAVAYAGACHASLRFAYQRARPATVAAIVVSVVLSALSGTRILAAMVFFAIAFATAGVLQALARHHETRLWRDRPGGALLLQPPVAGSWTVVGGGPFVRRNHHTSIPGERFAYDIVCTDGESFGQPVVAPIAGVVEDVRSDMIDGVLINWGRDARGLERRYGNFISIRVGEARVLLCHLRRGSVIVAPGTTVSAGQPLAQCGNSGRSFSPHLHVHAQDRPASRRGDAIAIAFARDRSAAVLVPGDVVSFSERDC